MDRSFILKLLGITILALAIMVPVVMTRDLINERQARRAEAVTGIATGWGTAQTIVGPILVVPYRRVWNEVVRETEDGKPRERRTERDETGVMRFPLEALEWNADLGTSEKTRGIYKARLYTSTVKASGRISIPPQFGINDPHSRYEWGDARLVIGIADPRGIRNLGPVQFGDRLAEFAPGTADQLIERGVQASVGALASADAKVYPVSFNLELAGSEAFAIAPIAKDTTVSVRANWPHPSFYGPFLPTKHESNNDGFTAHWRVSQFAASGATQVSRCHDGRKECAGFGSEVLGVSLIEPVGVYQQLDRASKYGFLFVGLSFAAFFLFELMRQLAIHPIQYSLVGLAVAIFFLLVTALSEHIAFGVAYLVATFACVSVVTFYVVRVLKSAALGSVFGSGLAALYGALYMLLNAEDYALLAGALLLFALLAGAMVITRRIDWYELTGSKRAPVGSLT
jgi:inner membrane protein